MIVDTSAWVAFFRGGDPNVVDRVDAGLARDLVGIGDLVYTEVMQGIRSPRDRRDVSGLLLALPRFDMAGFGVAEKSAANYRLLRSKGVTVRKTIDVLIGTFCAQHGFGLIHCESDFDRMARHIGLTIV